MANQHTPLKAYDDNKCIFIHIPKCGGISVGRALFNHYDGNHMNALTYQLAFSRSRYESYFKFSFVRNPWMRVASAYHYLRQFPMTQRDRIWAQANLPAYATLDDFVLGWITPQNVLTWEHFKPQHRFICSPSGQLKVDFVGRFERLEKDFAYVARRLGRNVALGHHNKTLRGNYDYRNQFSVAAIERIANVYRRDIELFNYQFDDVDVNAPVHKPTYAFTGPPRRTVLAPSFAAMS